MRVFRRPSASVDALLFVDASLEALGVAVKFPESEFLFFTALVPPGFSASLPAGSNCIFILELYAAFLGLAILQDLQRQRGYFSLNAILFEDNDSCQAALLRGHTRCFWATSVVSHFWHAQSLGPCNLRVERVRPKRNFADAPSRGMCPAISCEFPKIPISSVILSPSEPGIGGGAHLNRSRRISSM